jgi:hypothetical protein
MELLQWYDITILYGRGVDNCAADALSQLPAAFTLFAAFTRSQSHLQARGPSSEGGEARVPQPHSAPELAKPPSDKGTTSITQELQEQSPMQETFRIFSTA